MSLFGIVYSIRFGKYWNGIRVIWYGWYYLFWVILIINLVMILLIMCGCLKKDYFEI